MTAIVILSGAAGCGCFAEVYARLRRSQGLVQLLLVFEFWVWIADAWPYGYLMDQIFLSLRSLHPLIGCHLAQCHWSRSPLGSPHLGIGHLPQWLDVIHWAGKTLPFIDALDEFLWSGFPWYVFGNRLSCYLQQTVLLLVTADVQQINNCHVTYAQGTAVFNASQRSWWVACHGATSWRTINCGKGGGCGKL